MAVFFLNENCHTNFAYAVIVLARQFPIHTVGNNVEMDKSQTDSYAPAMDFPFSLIYFLLAL